MYAVDRSEEKRRENGEKEKRADRMARDGARHDELEYQLNIIICFAPIM